MSFWDRIRGKSPAVPPAEVPAPQEKVRVVREIRRVQEAMDPSAFHRAQDVGYRRITQSSRRDLTPIRHDWMQKLANYLWASHPVAKKCIQNHRNFIAGQGFKATATSSNPEARKKVQAVLDHWWKINEWNEQLSRRVETLSVEGEWVYYCPPCNPYSGAWKMAKILPENVLDVLRCSLDAERLKTVRLRERLEFDHNGQRFQKETLEILHHDWTTGRLEGDCLFLAINSLSGQTRGFSDLLAVSDYLDVFDTTVFTEAERIQIQRSFAWKVHLKGQNNDERLEQRRQEIQDDGAPRPGEILIHNDDEEWDTISPRLELGESIEFVRLLLTLILGGLHNPQHWFSEGGDVNKATASEMGGPAFAVIRERKAAIALFLRRALELALQRACEYHLLQVDKEDLIFEVVSQEPERSAFEVNGQILGTIGESLTLGVQMKWITEHEAAQSFRQAASELGLGEFPGVPADQTLAGAQKMVKDSMIAQRPALEKIKPLEIKAA